MRNRDFLGRVLADWPAKVLSLCAALLLFFFYQLNRLENRPLSVPLEVKVGADFVPASQYPRSVRVTTIELGVPAVLFSRIVTGPVAVIIAFVFSIGLF